MGKHPSSLPRGVCFPGAQSFPGRSGMAHPMGILYCLPFLPLPSPLSYRHLPNTLLLNKILVPGSISGEPHTKTHIPGVRRGLEEAE